MSALPEHFTLFSFDQSQRRPGFCRQNVTCKDDIFYITHIKQYNVNNKSSKNKTHGAILEEIYQAAKAFMLSPAPHDKCYCVRERGYIARSSFAESGKFEVVGIINLLAHRQGFEFTELSPTTVKKLVAGSGAASKPQVAEALKTYVGNLPYKCDDESDALAVGIAWLMQHGEVYELPPDGHTSDLLIIDELVP